MVMKRTIEKKKKTLIIKQKICSHFRCSYIITKSFCISTKAAEDRLLLFHPE